MCIFAKIKLLIRKVMNKMYWFLFPQKTSYNKDLETQKVRCQLVKKPPKKFILHSRPKHLKIFVILPPTRSQSLHTGG